MENVLDPGSRHMNAVCKSICGQIHRDHKFIRENLSHGGVEIRLHIAFSSFLTFSSVIIDNLYIKEVVAFDLKANPVLITDPNAVLFLPVSLSLRGYRFFFAECARTPTRVIPARPNRIKNSHSAGLD